MSRLRRADTLYIECAYLLLAGRSCAASDSEIVMRHPWLRLLHKGESLCCFRDSASVTYGGM